jgi:hypothetical protein
VKVLVLGNDPQINQINFSKLNKSVITLGVNRIWLKHIPNYFFAHDIEIFNELKKIPEKEAHLQSTSNCFTSDWLFKNNRSAPPWVRLHSRPIKNSFPDSVTTAISIYNSVLCNSTKITYYIAGVSLKWTNPSHFWKEIEYSSLNKHGENWYSPRFDRIFNNFKRLKDSKLNIISVNPNSNLNKLFRYESIENLYS